MKAVTVIPLVKDSLALRDMPKPLPKRGQVLLSPIEVGVCGTDKDIIEGKYGAPPPGEEYLILGHEAVAEVVELGDGVDNVGVGDVVVPTVRRPTTCTLPITELDYCPRGTYAEHGIWYLHGFAAEFAVTDSQYLVKVPKEAIDVAVLTEPLSIVEKGIDLALRLGRARFESWSPRRVLIMGAGPIGMLALMVMRLRGFTDITVTATRPYDSLKAKLVREIGATYVNTNVDQISGDFDIVIEATGSTSAAYEALRHLGADGVAVLLGIYLDSKNVNIGPLLDDWRRNKLIIGATNASIKAFEMGVSDLVKAKFEFGGWVRKLITKEVTLDEYEYAYNWGHDDIKSVIQIRSL
ncbi:glucose 1-dehydrogenase [Vulcanisaeta sp. JCM 16161]|uniref:alcohol dehydrogenase catalytic domain-containing protein n=1 Tax=Vulcanisaeta sp. JCM 16161 TaxID=1295372 RepID=UPI0006CFEF9C|nr:alcohol dehydrogenase catalytic domain-containing protein [Vulcanisaeta sp. JCM 16161]